MEDLYLKLDSLRIGTENTKQAINDFLEQMDIYYNDIMNLKDCWKDRNTQPFLDFVNGEKFNIDEHIKTLNKRLFVIDSFSDELEKVVGPYFNVGKVNKIRYSKETVAKAIGYLHEASTGIENAKTKVAGLVIPTSCTCSSQIRNLLSDVNDTELIQTEKKIDRLIRDITSVIESSKDNMSQIVDTIIDNNVVEENYTVVPIVENDVPRLEPLEFDFTKFRDRVKSVNEKVIDYVDFLRNYKDEESDEISMDNKLSIGFDDTIFENTPKKNKDDQKENFEFFEENLFNKKTDEIDDENKEKPILGDFFNAKDKIQIDVYAEQNKDVTNITNDSKKLGDNLNINMNMETKEKNDINVDTKIPIAEIMIKSDFDATNDVQINSTEIDTNVLKIANDEFHENSSSVDLNVSNINTEKLNLRIDFETEQANVDIPVQNIDNIDIKTSSFEVREGAIYNADSAK